MRIDVPPGPERFEVGQLDRTTDQGLWRFWAPHDGYHVEVLLAGDEASPDPAWLDLAARVTLQLGPLVAVSRYYLQAFVDEGKLDGPGEWGLDWLEFGRHPDDMPEPFELVLVHGGDGYGGWGVRFFRGHSGWRPYEFRRFQR